MMDATKVPPRYRHISLDGKESTISMQSYWYSGSGHWNIQCTTMLCCPNSFVLHNKHGSSATNASSATKGSITQRAQTGTLVPTHNNDDGPHESIGIIHVFGWVWHAAKAKGVWPESEENFQHMMQPPWQCVCSSRIGLYYRFRSKPQSSPWQQPKCQQ